MVRDFINVIIGLLYLGIGAFVIWQKWFVTELSPWATYAFGTLLIIYGTFRIYRAVQAIRHQDN